MLIALLVPLSLAVLAFTFILLRAALARHSAPNREATIVGAITNFFDTLGIGSFAPTMAWFKFRKLVPDRLIPPTMLVGHSLPTMAQAIIFLILLCVLVDPVLLIMFSLMGLDPRLIFPIMAGGGGLMVAGAGVRHIGMGQIELRIAVGVALGGIPAVFLAALIVKEMPLEALRWLVINCRLLRCGRHVPVRLAGLA